MNYYPKKSIIIKKVKYTKLIIFLHLIFIMKLRDQFAPLSLCVIIAHSLVTMFLTDL